MKIPKNNKKIEMQNGMAQVKVKNPEKANEIKRYIDWILIIGLICVVLWAKGEGIFIKKTQIDTCLGVPTDCKGDEMICNKIIQATKDQINNNPLQTQITVKKGEPTLWSDTS